MVVRVKDGWNLMSVLGDKVGKEVPPKTNKRRSTYATTEEEEGP